ncbi:unnamed protein product [Penicillium salamii]|uniref:FAD-binding domain-containing protein n=1 Tax=Penicillium salamii TaxID=1612424 RepID=A0A9W4J7X1_9EURO|nr:unnamed protein product [Penicillium salamii]CAG7979878.1 unnamed protein product [Penicillium salamii]CAG8079106.1 unnamed protein product [Penicillium salamii]CAG8082735.1 unnamed protein product [Penicillium salamii]CAG8237439.1 unnamed protein product [Penicillium salamii]
MRPDTSIAVAIIGGGIAGVTAAIGLLSKGISVKLYERASAFREIGAGIGLSPNAERAMLLLNPDVHAVFKKVATPNTEDWFQYVDGFNKSEKGDGEELLFKVYLGERGFEGCRRTDFLNELVKLLPEGCVEFRKDLVNITEPQDEGTMITLHFADGSTSTADVVLGCDGLRSRVREHVLGVEHPAVRPSYTHKLAYRGVIPIEDAIQAIGKEKSLTRFMHLGPGCHVLTFPVSMCTMLNVVAFVTDPNDWPSLDQTTLPATKEEVLESFASFGPVVTAIMNLLVHKLDKWGIFDLHESPVTTYVSQGGRVCLVGDAAHAAAPHHGAGAGSAIEDALALAVALEEVDKTLSASQQPVSRQMAISAAFSAYESVRYERTQWLIESSRFMGEVFEWQTALCEADPANCQSEVEWRSHKIWDYDVDQMVEAVSAIFGSKVSEALGHDRGL